jgi:hypothetical protein
MRGEKARPAGRRWIDRVRALTVKTEGERPLAPPSAYGARPDRRRADEQFADEYERRGPIFALVLTASSTDKFRERSENQLQLN